MSGTTLLLREALCGIYGAFYGKCVLSLKDTVVIAMAAIAGLLLAAMLGFVTWHRVFTGKRSRRQTELKPDEYEASRLPLPPGSLGLPVIGEMAQFILEAASGEFFAKRERRHGPIFKTHILGRPTVYVAGPEAIKTVLMGEHSLVETAWPPAMKYLLGVGALSSLNGDCHRIRRRHTMAILGRERGRRYASLLMQIIREELNSWATTEPIDVYMAAKRLTTRAAARVLLGIDLQRRHEPASETTRLVNHMGDSEDATLTDLAQDLDDFGAGFFAIPIPFPGTAFYKALAARRRLCGTLAAILKSTDSRQHDDIMTDIFLADTVTSSTTPETGLSKKDPTSAINQALELLFGGQETLSGTITCILMLMAPRQDHNAGGRDDGSSLNQPAYEKMIDEIRRKCSGDIEFDDVNGRLDYVDAVIKEVLRLWPPIGGGYRRAKQTFDIAGYQVPRGWAVTYSIKGTHERSPLFFPDSSSFNPDRWLSSTELTADSSSFNFVPFGAGARSCVGRQYAMLFVRTFCIELARTYRRWRLLTSHPVPMLTVPTIRPRDKLYAVLDRW